MGQLRFLERDEVDKLLAIPNIRSETGLRNRIIMQLQWETGMRIGEALDLRVRDVILDEKKVIIEKGKGSKTRVVYWRSDELTMLLQKWKKKRPVSEYLFATVRSKDGKGSKVEPRSFRIQFDRYVQKAGLPEWTTSHVLRHSYATNFLRNNRANVRTLQTVLGHSSLAVTEKYLHVTDEDVRKAMRGD